MRAKALSASVKSTPSAVSRYEDGNYERYEVQTLVSDYRDWAPRLGFAWSPGNPKNGKQKMVFRGGFGMYDTPSMGSIYYALTGTLQSNTLTFNNDAIAPTRSGRADAARNAIAPVKQYPTTPMRAALTEGSVAR